jgi:diguanylate cyclase (GGDEF)-like protein
VYLLIKSPIEKRTFRPSSGKIKNNITTLRSSLNTTRESLKEISVKLDRNEFESKLLREINTAITSTFELSEILSLILQVLTTLVNTEGVSLLLIQESDNTLRIAESHGLSTKDIENFYIYYARLNDGIFYDIKESKKPKFFTNDIDLAIPLQLSAPLISHNKVIGFLNIHSMYKNKQLTKVRTQLVYALASQASIAISNAQMFAAMREQAIIDHCTGLFNFRYFQQKLDEALESAESNEECLSLVILDIDFFKHVNDAWGHLYGDIVLKELANLLKRNVRSEDSVCRYGGEEFTIIFPHCDFNTTLKIAERIRTKIQETTTNDRRGFFKEPITVSVGITEFRPGISKTELISQADNALYWSKNNGRNCSHVYDRKLASEYEEYAKK